MVGTQIVLQPQIQINKPVQSLKNYLVSKLPSLTDEEVNQKVEEAKKITFSSEKRNMIQEICKNNSLTCAQARLFADLFRASYEKVFLIRI
jgi:hypothetical protein